MGKGDKRSRKGKTHIGTFGKYRSRKKGTKSATAKSGPKAKRR